MAPSGRTRTGLTDTWPTLMTTILLAQQGPFILCNTTSSLLRTTTTTSAQTCIRNTTPGFPVQHFFIDVPSLPEEQSSANHFEGDGLGVWVVSLANPCSIIPVAVIWWAGWSEAVCMRGWYNTGKSEKKNWVVGALAAA